MRQGCWLPTPKAADTAYKAYKLEDEADEQLSSIAHTVSQRLRRLRKIPAELWPLGSSQVAIIFVNAQLLTKIKVSSLPSPSRLLVTLSPGICLSTRPSVSSVRTEPLTMSPTPVPRSTTKKLRCDWRGEQTKHIHGRPG